MLHQLIKFHYNQPFILACSGGIDSMAIADFYSWGAKNFGLAYFNHGTPQANEMQECVVKFGIDHKLLLHLGKIERDKGKGESPEELVNPGLHNMLRKKIISSVYLLKIHLIGLWLSLILAHISPLVRLIVPQNYLINIL